MRVGWDGNNSSSSVSNPDIKYSFNVWIIFINPLKGRNSTKRGGGGCTGWRTQNGSNNQHGKGRLLMTGLCTLHTFATRKKGEQKNKNFHGLWLITHCTAVRALPLLFPSQNTIKNEEKTFIASSKLYSAIPWLDHQALQELVHLMKKAKISVVGPVLSDFLRKHYSTCPERKAKCCQKNDFISKLLFFLRKTKGRQKVIPFSIIQIDTSHVKFIHLQYLACKKDKTLPKSDYPCLDFI